MTAPHIEQVNVLRRADEPAHFLWKGRLYAVRSVRAHWYEAQGVGTPDVVPVGATALVATALVAVGGDSAGDRPPSATQAAPGGGDRELWRVEAAAGRTAVPGVFDLCLAWPNGEWTLSPVDGEDG